MISNRLRPRAHVAVILVCALALLASCSVEETMHHPDCSGGSSLLAAQSVPSAQLLPCFQALPVGWEVDTVIIDETGTRVVFDSDRAGGASARFHFVDQCDTGDAVSTPTDRTDTERFEDIREIGSRLEASRYYVFDGGCVWWDFNFAAGVPAAMSVELDNTLQLLDRQLVNDDLRETFIDEEL